jgi:hypothetical protein
MTTHPRYQHRPEDLFLHVFVFVDDWLKQNEAQFKLPRQSHQVASYSELLTIALVGEMLAQPFESVWYWLVKHSYQDLFPSLPSASRYHRILRNAEGLLAQLACAVVPQADLHLIDSKPLPIAKGKRKGWARLPEARLGFSTLGAVFGFKLHALSTSTGLFRRWAFVPADAADVTVARVLLEGLEEEVVLGDKAYLGSSATTPPRKNMTRETGWCKLFDRLRKRIETTFSSLARSLTLHAAQVKTFWSLRTRVNLKIAAYNLLHSGVLFR